MARSGDLRDMQRKRLYVWEKNTPVLADFWKAPSMLRSEVILLCKQILRDAGCGVDHVNRKFKIEFNCRSGGAHGSERGVDFTPTYLPKIIVLHEMAHALTWPSRDKAGHGPAYLACYLTLLNRYLGVDMAEMMRSLKSTIQIKQNVFTYVPVIIENKMYRKQVLSTKTKNIKPPVFDINEVGYWRKRFNEGRIY